MKKFLINSFGVMFLLSFVTTCQLPLFAACPIEGGETVCSLPDFREQVSPTYSPKSNISEFSDTGEARLNPIKRDDIEQEFKRFRPVKRTILIIQAVSLEFVCRIEVLLCFNSLSNKKEGRPLFFITYFF